MNDVPLTPTLSLNFLQEGCDMTSRCIRKKIGGEGATWRCQNKKGFRTVVLNPQHALDFPRLV
jgi:hypothetical protein